VVVGAVVSTITQSLKAAMTDQALT